MPLSIDQIQAFEEIKTFLHSSQNEHILTGSPGMGKTYLTKELIQYMYANEMVPIATATTNQAVSVLEEFCNISCTTIHSFLNLKVMHDFVHNKTYLAPKEKKGKPLPFTKNTIVVIVDEASYIDEDLYQYIYEMFLIGVKIKFLYIGDKNQLPPVDSTVPFIFGKNINTSTLTTNHRFGEESSINQICKELKYEIENTSYYVPNITSSPNIHILDGDEFQNKLKEFYTSPEFFVDPFYVKTLAFRNIIVDGINELIREYLGYTENFQPGERIVFGSPYFDKSSPEEPRLAANGEVFEIEDMFLTEYEEIPGWTITFRHPEKRNKMFKGFYTTHTRLVGMKKKELIQKKKFYQVEKFLNNCINIKPLYASTVHKAQGASYDNVFIHAADLFTCRDISLLPRLLYVALSRAKENVYIYGTVPQKFWRKK